MTIPFVALVLSFSATPPSIPTISETVVSTLTSVNIQSFVKSTEKFTAQSLAGEYTLVVTDAVKREAETSGIKEFKGKLLLNADNSFEFHLITSRTDLDTQEPKLEKNEVKIKGDFKLQGNVVLLTSKSEVVNGKEQKSSPTTVKCSISPKGTEFKVDAQPGFSFIRKALK
ncbi:hypothetical protein TUMEXPCC7403_03955 [Tumidithrix helvetica PCC 7403]|uniref:hypothetical protein n=1 Tax=Tumidithrix helvetica TaxID=3457545 RepID=UPI003C8A20BE